VKSASTSSTTDIMEEILDSCGVKESFRNPGEAYLAEGIIDGCLKYNSNTNAVYTVSSSECSSTSIS